LRQADQEKFKSNIMKGIMTYDAVASQLCLLEERGFIPQIEPRTRPEELFVLIGCEESQAIAKAFRRLGVQAYSCDLKPCSGGHPEYHLQMDVFEAIKLRKWHAAIFHPECTYLTISANRWYKDQPEKASGILVGAARREAREKAIAFFMRLYNCGIPHIAVENPIGVMGKRFRKADQILQPWMFGHGETKATCLWLKGFPKIRATNIVSGREQVLFKLPPSKDRAELRSKTYEGIARAIAEQYTEFLVGIGFNSYNQY